MGIGDVRRPDLYDCDPPTTLAVNVALATGRPILVSGPSGCGKTSLARFIAHVMNWSLRPLTITSRSQARDLLYTVDDLRRLQDSRGGRADATMKTYILPGVLWLAFDASSAQTKEPSIVDTDAEQAAGVTHIKGKGTVVLLDEIDKADPDVPNNLLEPLGSYRFSVPELEIGEQSSFVVRTTRPPLVVLTTNNERRLPDAFLRRCVDLPLKWPTRTQLLRIAAAHHGAKPTVTTEWLTKVLELLCPGGVQPETVGLSTAEFLDTVQACLALEVKQPGWAWDTLPAITVKKSTRLEDE
jgi:MoxR-like ATPase